MQQKLVRDKRKAASSITGNEERVYQIEEKQENTKCVFQIEQETKVKDTEGIHPESYTYIERPNTKQGRNIEGSIAKGSNAMKAT